MSMQGVYAILHVATGAAYIGASRHVTNRYTWHRYRLRRNTHPSAELQKLWNKTKGRGVLFVLLEFCRGSLSKHEDKWIKRWPGEVLNARPERKGWKHSLKTRTRQSISRAVYLDKPGARESLSERAKKQHADGNFGRSTWLS